MTSEPLDNLVRVGSLKAEIVSAGEIERLVQSGLARLVDAKNTSLSMESRFDLAYNAITYALAQATLWASGYRATQRYIVSSAFAILSIFLPKNAKCSIKPTTGET